LHNRAERYCPILRKRQPLIHFILVGIVNVPDSRLDKLGEINRSEKVVPAIMEFVDIAGIVKGASEGAGLGNKFLANIRMTDAIVHVVRCFIDNDIIHGIVIISATYPSPYPDLCMISGWHSRSYSGHRSDQSRAYTR